MRKVIASVFVSLDGFIVGENEDMSWVADNFDGEFGREMSDHINSLGGILLGRITYEIMSGYWPNAAPSGNYDQVKPAEGSEDPVITDRMNSLPKIVFSKTLEKVEWGKYNNVTLVKEITKDEILKLKKESGKDLEIMGSASVIQSIMNLNLIDEFRLMIFPVILGKGKLLFRNTSHKTDLNLIEVKTFNNGAVILRYHTKNT